MRVIINGVIAGSAEHPRLAYLSQHVAITTLVSDMPAYTHFNTATPSLYSYSTGFKASYLRLFKDQLRSLNLFNHAYKSLI